MRRIIILDDDDLEKIKNLEVIEVKFHDGEKVCIMKEEKFDEMRTDSI